MNAIEDEKSVLRWGGLAGILAAFLFILAFVIQIAFVGWVPADPEGVLMKFPDVRAAYAGGSSLYLLGLILWVTLFLALYRALRGTNLAPALFGSVLGILGLAVLAAGALPHVAVAPISDLYHAPGATAEDKAIVVLLYQASQGIFNALFVVGLLLVPIGLIALGVAMLGAPAFGKGFGRVTVVLGVIGVIATSVLLVDPSSPISLVVLSTFIIFPLLLGWKVHSLSTAP